MDANDRYYDFYCVYCGTHHKGNTAVVPHFTCVRCGRNIGGATPAPALTAAVVKRLRNSIVAETSAFYMGRNQAIDEAINIVNGEASLAATKGA